MQSFEIQRLRELISRAKSAQLNDIELARVDQTIRTFKKELDDYGQLIDQLNEPAVLSEDLSSRLAKLKNVSLTNASGAPQALLESHEALCKVRSAKTSGARSSRM